MNDTEIVKALNPFLSEALRKKYIETKELYEKKPEIFREPFLKEIDRLMKLVAEKQADDEKGKVAYICFSFLYSNVMLNKNALRIDVFDKNIFFDTKEIVGEWKLDYFFSSVEQDMSKAFKILSSNYIRIKRHEEKELFNSYLFNYYMLAEVVLRALAPSISTLESFQSIEKEEKVIVTYGEYMDKMQEIAVFR